MKKTFIGGLIFIAGIFNTMGIIVSAAICLPYYNGWSTSYPSKLWFLIFAGKSRFADGGNGLGLGVLFVCGIVLTVAGLFILIKEYFKKNS